MVTWNRMLRAERCTGNQTARDNNNRLLYVNEELGFESVELGGGL